MRGSKRRSAGCLVPAGSAAACIGCAMPSLMSPRPSRPWLPPRCARRFCSPIGPRPAKCCGTSPASCGRNGRSSPPLSTTARPMCCPTWISPSSTAANYTAPTRSRRELLADGRPIKLGGCAFDVLIALIEARGAVIGKDKLTGRVWPDRIVDENNLQSQISALRAVLGPDRDLIRTVAGRGYQFTGEIRILAASPDEGGGAAAVQPTPTASATNLPQPVCELIGRD